MSNIFMKILSGIFPTKNDDEKTRLFKQTVYSFLGMAVILIVSALAVFFLVLEGEEETLVPQVVELDLADAILKLQQKDLGVRIELRYSNDYFKNTIISQDPPGGKVVKAGREIVLTVSEGPAGGSTVPDFIGLTLDEVRSRLGEVWERTGQESLLNIKEPVIYQFSTKPAGTVLEQNPIPETVLNGRTSLELIVSKGRQEMWVQVPSLLGVSYEEAAARLASLERPFTFTIREKEGDEEAGVIVSQNPRGGASIPQTQAISLVSTIPTGLDDTEVFGVFRYTLPVYHILMPFRLEVRPLEGESRTLIQWKQAGGEIAIPYLLQAGDTLALYFEENEIHNQRVIP